MKTHALFGGLAYYPSGGIYDLKGTGTFQEMKDLVWKLMQDKDRSVDWAHVVDLSTLEAVFDYSSILSALSYHNGESLTEIGADYVKRQIESFNEEELAEYRRGLEVMNKIRKEKP